MSKAVLAVADVPLEELSTYHRNPRRGNVDAIVESLAARGQYKPIVVNIGTATGRPMEILAGNHTFLAARQLGWSSIQVVTVDVDEAGAAQIVAADNRIADLGGYDDEDLLAVLELAGDLDGTGYAALDVAALERALADPIALTDPDDAPSIPSAAPISHAGDVWELGPHRLYVGSSGDADAVLEAAQGVVDCVWTDPPYGVNYSEFSSPEKARASRKRLDGLTVANDSPDDALAAWADALGTVFAVCRPGAPFYAACPAGPLHFDFVRILRESGILHRQTLIWVKDRMVLGRSDYHYQHEPILGGVVPVDAVDEHAVVEYGFTPDGEGRLGRGGERWHGDNKQVTVFEVARPKASRVHPTMKPVELIEPMLRNSCPPGGLVFDPFAGSGSAMIAAHHAGVRALMCELDPEYADVICRRWQQHTGLVPVRDGVEVDFVNGGGS